VNCVLSFTGEVKNYPPFSVTASVGGNPGKMSARLGEYTFDKIWNNAAAYANGNYILFYGGQRDGWQWVQLYSYWAANMVWLCLTWPMHKLISSLSNSNC